MRRLPLACLAAATLALTACGGDGGPGPTAGSAQSTGSASEAAATSPSSAAGGSSTSSSTSTDTGKPFDPKEFTERLEAAVDAHPTVSIDVTATIAGQSEATATGVQDLARDALDMDVTLGAQELGYKLVDGQYYLAQPPKWVEVSEDSTNPLVRTTLDQIQILSMRRQLDAFLAGVEQAGDKGREEIEGVPTTHYTATVDTETSLRELDIERGEGVPDTVVYDVWLDSDDLIRKMEFNVNGVTATMVASEWGEPVSITAPKPWQLAEPT